MRGIIHPPIIGAAETLHWGVWGSLSRENFETLLKMDDDRISPIVQYVVKNDDEEETPLPGAEPNEKVPVGAPPESQENKPEDHQEAKH